MSIFDTFKKMSAPKEVKILRETIEELKTYRDTAFVGAQDIQRLIVDWEVGQARTLDGVNAMLIQKNDKTATFLEAIPPGVCFRLHWHLNNQDEKITVIKGEIKDDYVNYPVLRAGESVVYKGGAKNKHQPGNNSKEQWAFILVVIYFNSRR